MVTGTVTALNGVSISAIRYSFQVNTKVKIAVDAMPGRITGTTMRQMICSRDNPSSSAASSSSTGTSARKPRISQIANGRVESDVDR